MTSHDVAFGRSIAPERFPWATHVRWAVESETLFVLDLRKNVYLSLPLARLQAGDSDALQREFKARGLLKGEGVLAAPTPGVRGLLGDGFASFWLALLWARRVMRRRELDVAACMLAAAAPPIEPKAEEMIARFRNWRPLYPRDTSCLFDALALGRYLWSAGVRSELVYAVRGGPFAAHAWLEIGGVIVNDDPEYCAGFTPMRTP